jgi:pyridoxal phosphate enzyme (YggS family)
MSDIAGNWEVLQERVARAAEKAGRRVGEIEVVAVAKTRTPREVEQALRCGLRLIGENRVQEAEAKKKEVKASGQWHLVGHLQTNKAAKALELFDLVQSLDSLRLAQTLDQKAAQKGRVLDVLVQVNTSGNPGQFGVAPEKLWSLAEQLAPLEHLRLRGLMTIGELSQDEKAVRGCFSRLRSLRDQLIAAGFPNARWLSMGMSGDFELAIAEGADLLRLGTAIFGPRPG